MKKLALTLITSIVLSACGAVGGTGSGGMSASSMGTSVVKMYVQNKCVNELQSRNEWRLAALAMTQEKQTEWENKICSCASEEAPNQVTAAELPQLMTESGRTKVAAEVATRTVTACYKRLFTK